MKLINEVFIGSLTGKSENEQKEFLKKYREDNRKEKIKISIVPNLVDKEFIKILKQTGIIEIMNEIYKRMEQIIST